MFFERQYITSYLLQDEDINEKKLNLKYNKLDECQNDYMLCNKNDVTKIIYDICDADHYKSKKQEK